MRAGETQPTQPIPTDWAYAEARRRRRIWPWLIAFAIVGGLAIAAWFAGEAIARDLVTRTIRDSVVTQLSLPAGQEVQVDVPGQIIPQLVGGSFGEVTIASDDVPIGSFVGDVSVTAYDVPVRGGAMGGAVATIALDEEQLRGLMATVDGFPAESLGLRGSTVTMSTELSLFGVGFPVGVSLTPAAVDAALVLSPAALQLADVEITADRLREQFGVVADLVLRDWTVCLAEHIPAGLTLTDVAVDGDGLAAEFDVHGAILANPDLRQNGTCEEPS